MKKITLMACMLIAGYTAQAQLSYEAKEDYGRLRDLNYDLGVEDKLYAATLGNHIVVSYDNGTTWDLLYAFPNTTAQITNLKALPGGETLCFSVINSVDDNGIYVYSIEDGEMINTIALPDAEGLSISSFDVYDAEGTTILLNVSQDTGSTVYYTSTSGENWATVYDMTDYNNVSVTGVAIGTDDPNKLYLTRGNGTTDIDGGIFMSDDAGETWTEKLPGINFRGIDISSFDSDDILVGTDGGPASSYEENIYRSTDGGLTWTAQDITWTDEDYQSILVIKFHPTVEGIIFALEDNEIVYTNNNGDSWTSTVYGSESIYYYGLSLSINPSDTKEAAFSTDFYPGATRDGGATVDQLKAPFYNVMSLGAVKFDGQEHLYYIGQGGRLHKNYETNMTDAYDVQPTGGFGGGTSTIVADPLTPGRVFTFGGGFMGGSVSVSTDNGATTTPILSTFALDLVDVAADPGNANVVYITLDNFGTGEVHRLDITDLANITDVTFTIPDASGPGAGVLVYPADVTNTLFTGIGNVVYKSTDDGTTWTAIFTIDGAIAIADLAKNPFDLNELAVAADTGIYTSTDMGENWTTSLEGFAVRKIKYSDLDSGFMAAGLYNTDGDANVKYYNGTDWVTVPAAELNYMQSYNMDFNFIGDNISAYVGTVDMGVIRYNFPIGELGTNNPVTIRKDIVLAPNPASGYVTVSTGAGSFEIKSIAIYSITGQKVLEAATNTIDVSRLSNGVYIVKAETDNGGSISKKLIKE
jgi:xyloglucan-specific exo-beta-1,4-glucanase